MQNLNSNSLFRAVALVACTLGAVLNTVEPAVAATGLLADAAGAARPEPGPWALGLAARSDSAALAPSDSSTFAPTAADSTPKLVSAAKIVPHAHKSIAPQVGAGVGCLLGILIAKGSGKTAYEPTGNAGYDLFAGRVGAGMSDAMSDAGTVLLCSLLGMLVGFAVSSSIANSSPASPPTRDRSLEAFEAKPAQLEVAAADSAATDSSAVR